MVLLRSVASSWLILALTAFAQQNTTSAPTVTIEKGSIRGRTTQLPNANVAVNQFLAIPYAQPPVNNSRWAGPREIDAWSTTLDATEQPPSCLQYFGKPGPRRDLNNLLFNTPSVAREDEDCLYLNVYAPQGGASDKAVLFWIHGGSNFQGSAALPLYDGTDFAGNQDIIVVVPNYRLNVFGSPRAPGIPIEEAAISQSDVNMALNWTTRNIEQFGGVPDKITIAGESAGAVATGNLVNTFPNNTPFRAAIEMSGSALVVPLDLGGADPDAAWPSLVELLNCSGTTDEAVLECMRAVPAETIEETLNDNGIVFSTQPHNNNITSLERPDLAWAEGNVAKVPLLIGYTADDGGYFVRDPAMLTLASNISLNQALTALNLSETLATTLSSLYSPGSPYAADINNTRDALYQLATDITFGCTSAFVANMSSNLLDVPVWEYLFDSVAGSNFHAAYPDLGAYHAGELGFLFGTYLRDNATDLDAQVSRSIQTHFASFIKDPQQGPGWEQWPQVGILGVADSSAVTTTQSAQELQPVCQVFNNLWLATEVPALTQAQTQNSSEPTGGNDTPSMASRGALTGWSVVVGAVMFAVALASW